LNRYPRAGYAKINVRRLQARGLHGFQRGDVAPEKVVVEGFEFGIVQLGYHVTRKVFFGSFPALVGVAVVFLRVEEDTVIQFGNEVVYRFPAKMRHIG